jgi:hypothetical protein
MECITKNQGILSEALCYHQYRGHKFVRVELSDICPLTEGQGHRIYFGGQAPSREILMPPVTEKVMTMTVSRGDQQLNVSLYSSNAAGITLKRR